MIGSPLHLNNLQKVRRILLADVLLFEAPVFGGGALDGDLDRVVAVAAVDGVSGMDLEFLSFLQKYAYSIIFVYYKRTNKFYGSERLDRRGNDLIVGSVL